MTTFAPRISSPIRSSIFTRHSAQERRADVQPGLLVTGARRQDLFIVGGDRIRREGHRDHYLHIRLSSRTATSARHGFLALATPHIRGRVSGTGFVTADPPNALPAALALYPLFRHFFEHGVFRTE